MSRKAHADRSSWNTASLFAFSGGYGPFKPRGPEPIENAMVLFRYNRDDTSASADSTGEAYFSHPLYSLAGEAQQLLLNSSTSSMETLLVVDLSDMVEDLPAALKKEASEAELTKGFGRTLLRLLERLRLSNTTWLAYGDCCPLVLKLAKNLPAEVVSSMWLLHPVLPPKFVNLFLVKGGNNNKKKGKQQQVPQLHLVFETELARDRRIDMLRHSYPQGTTKIIDQSVKPLLLASLSSEEEDTPTTIQPTYDPEYCNDMGKSLFLSSVKVEISKYTKQYERYAEEITEDLLQKKQPTIATTSDSTNMDLAAVDWSKAQRHIGALILRGNRCVLCRSLQGAWNGMKIPSLPQTDANETPHETAIKAVVQFTEVDPTEVTAMPDVPPVEIFLPQIDGKPKPTRIQLYALYATEPPPDGPLEDQDMEDEEYCYDWYLYENAVQKLDPRSIAGLQTMALVLVERANLGLIPCKWGGVFGQELKLASNDATTDNNTTLALTATTEEWQPSRQGDMLQDVRKANEKLMQRLKNDNSGATKKKLPVTLLSGFLGSGKTTLLQHILTNYSGLKVAILVNDMGSVNIDAALVQNKATSVRQREEHMVEMSNGCICCTLREDLLIEVAKIAAEGTFDCLLIESSGVSEPMPVAETFTFKDSTGLTLGDVAEIDTLVTVVDGSRFLQELDSLESLRARNWHADPQDERTISHLLCDQVEFANVIVLNKCDLIPVSDKEKVQRLIKSMNPQAKVVESTFSKVPLDTVLGTGLFSLAEAEKHQGWLQEARIGEHTPETEEYGISSFTFRSIKPFLPHKLYEVLEAILSKSSPPYNESVVLRAKGFLWFANCPQLQGDFSLAGNHYSITPGNPWWAEIDKSNWPAGLEEAIVPLWHEPYGDRQQEIVIIGQSLNQQAIIESLQNCLVSDEVMAKGQDTWYEICNEEGDPFAEAWDAAIQAAMAAHDHEHEHSHGHEHDHHDH